MKAEISVEIVEIKWYYKLSFTVTSAIILSEPVSHFLNAVYGTPKFNLLLLQEDHCRILTLQLLIWCFKNEFQSSTRLSFCSVTSFTAFICCPRSKPGSAYTATMKTTWQNVKPAVVWTLMATTTRPSWRSCDDGWLLQSNRITCALDLARGQCLLLSSRSTLAGARHGVCSLPSCHGACAHVCGPPATWRLRWGWGRGGARLLQRETQGEEDALGQETGERGIRESRMEKEVACTWQWEGHRREV